MDYFVSFTKEDQISVTQGATTFDLVLGGCKKFALIVPAAMNGKTISFSVYNRTTDSWLSIGGSFDLLLATGVMNIPAATLVALEPFASVRCTLNSATASASQVQLNAKA